VATMCLLSMMLLFWCILGFSPASWLLGAEIATGLMVFRRLHRCHTIRCVRLLLTCPGRDGSTDGYPRMCWLSLPRRKVTAVGSVVGGRQLSSRNDRLLDHHGVISPVVRVSGCAQDDGVALATVFDHEDRLNDPLPARSPSSNPLCATSSSPSVLARMVVPMGFVVARAAGLLLRRKVTIAVGIFTGGRPLSSRNECFLESREPWDGQPCGVRLGVC
jgi:hypothetical protein